jgi:hypothetical protein
MRYSPCEVTSRFPACVERSLLFVRPNIAEGVGIRKAYPTGDALLRWKPRVGDRRRSVLMLPCPRGAGTAGLTRAAQAPLSQPG